MKRYICEVKIERFGYILSIGYFYVVEDLCVEFLYLWVRRGSGSEVVSYNNESFGGFGEVRYHVRDVTLGDVALCGGVQDLAKQELTHAAGGG